MNLPIEPLFQPFSLKGVTLRNRFVMSPMTRCFSPGGVPDANVAAYYARRARANVGLIVTEGTGVDHPSALGSSGANEKDIPVLHGTAALAGWKRVVDEVHDAGAAIFPQLWHMGPMRVAGTGPHPEARSARPSGLWGPPGLTSMSGKYLAQVGPPTEPMSEEEIADVIAAFGRSAANARDLGFDGIALHGAHGYLIDAFFWQQTNQRTDAFGGDLERRGKFANEIVRTIRAEVGPHMPILFRFSQWKIQNYDAVLVQSPQEFERFLAPLVEAGVDIFDVSARILTRPAFADSPLTLAGWTRKLSGLPVMAVGGAGLTKDLMTSLTSGTVTTNNLQPTLETFLRGEFDLLASARNLLNDPEWVNKVRSGEPFLPFDPEAYNRLY